MKLLGGLQCGFRHNRSVTDQIFFIRLTLEKDAIKWSITADTSGLHESLWFRSEVLCNILVEVTYAWSS